MEYISWAWLLIIAACLAIEAFTMGLTTIWFAIGGVAAWIVYFAGAGIEVQIIVFLLVSILCLFLTRPVVVKNLKVGKTRTNAESLIGEYAKVDSEINNMNNEGTVKVGGQVWSARSIDNEVIAQGEVVVIKKIVGVKLIVERK
nr:NfeD family protein [Sedimentibacter sp.]